MIDVRVGSQDQVEDLEAMARALEASGTYWVLRRLAPHLAVEPPASEKIRQGLVVDVETTGLDAACHEIIELAMVPFSYGLDGQIYAVGEPFHGLRQPSEPISAEITTITGITDEMVAGRSIDPAAVGSFAAGAALVIAHNAAFDRRFLERFCETFTTKAWVCSMSQVDWAGEGHEGPKLTFPAAGAGSSTSGIGRRTIAWLLSRCFLPRCRGAGGSPLRSCWSGRGSRRGGCGLRIRRST